jgi:hypothetical protein
MTLFRSCALTTIRVSNHKNLRGLTRVLDSMALSLVGSIHVDKPLTPAQLRRLPIALLEKLEP